MNSSICGKDLLLAIGEIGEDLLEIKTENLRRPSLYKRVALIASFTLIISAILLAYAGGIFGAGVGNSNSGDDSTNSPNNHTGSVIWNDIVISKYGFILQDNPDEDYFTVSAETPVIAFSFVYNGFNTKIYKIENGTVKPIAKKEENGKTIITVEADSTYVIKNEAFINDLVLTTEAFGDASIKITYSYEAKIAAH